MDAIEGPVMVIAGPGTGKTQILTLRVANILKQTDTPPDGILALTFTKSGVFSMRRRLVEIIGTAGYRVNIATFHGFCNEIIGTYPEEFPNIIGSLPATTADQIKILENIISDSKLSILKPPNTPFYYLRPILSEIDRLKRENITPKDFAKLVKAKEKDFDSIDDLYHEKGAHKGKLKGKYSDLKRDIEKNAELAEVYNGYEKALRENKMYDFGDMIMEVIKRLEANEDLLLKLQEQYLYILADEHQDANQSQNRLLELLSSFHDNPNLFLVGDEKQAIFQFQGASLDNFEYFHKLYPKARKISLSDNYRSSQLILDSSHSLITNGTDLQKESLVSLKANLKKENRPIGLHLFTLAEYQYRFVAESIQQKLDEGVEPDQIAVIYRDNRDAFPLLPYLDRLQIPVVVESEEDILADPDMAKFMMLLEGIADFGNEEKLGKIIHIDFLSLDRLDLYKVISCAQKQRLHLGDVLKSEKIMKGLSLLRPELLAEFFEKMSRWNEQGRNLNSSDAMEIILNESGFLKHLLSLPDSRLKLEKLRTLFDEAKKMTQSSRENNLNSFVDHLNKLAEHGVKLKPDFIESSGVRLMTAHRSKGLEFEVVYIIDAYDGHWGNKRKRNHFGLVKRGEEVATNSVDDERRLFFVALTRAKDQIYICSPTIGAEGKQFMPARFVEEIDKKYIEEVEVHQLEEKYRESRLEMLSIKPPKVSVSLSDKKMLGDLFNERGLSPTALNNFLKCPWRYYFVNLIRIPKAPNRAMSYGTAIHDALQAFFNKYRERDKVGEELLITFFKQAINRQPLSPQDFLDMEERGIKALSGYFNFYKNSWPKNILTEHKIRGAGLDDIKLTGKLDKIEFLSDKTVRVVDYKTGKPKSRNHIEGKTKSSNGDYKRQLVFYKLLLETVEGKNYEMTSGVIDFVEPDTKSGKYKKEEFEITETEVEELKSVIRDSVDSIRNLKFWNETCDDKDCEYCALRRMM